MPTQDHCSNGPTPQYTPLKLMFEVFFTQNEIRIISTEFDQSRIDNNQWQDLDAQFSFYCSSTSDVEIVIKQRIADRLL